MRSSGSFLLVLACLQGFLVSLRGAEAPYVTLPPTGSAYTSPSSSRTTYAFTVTGQPFGNGRYTAEVSSTYGGVAEQNIAAVFDGLLTGGFYTSQSNYYTGTDGSYGGSRSTSIVGGSVVRGEWLQLSMPEPIKLKEIMVGTRPGASGRFPCAGVMLGSNDNNWHFISNVGRDCSVSAQSGTMAVSSPEDAYYHKFRYVVLKTAADSWLSFSELSLVGSPIPPPTGVPTSAPTHLRDCAWEQEQAVKLGATEGQAQQLCAWEQVQALKYGATATEALQFSTWEQQRALELGATVAEALQFSTWEQQRALELGATVAEALQFSTWEQVEALDKGKTVAEALSA